MKVQSVSNYLPYSSLNAPNAIKNAAQPVKQTEYTQNPMNLLADKNYNSVFVKTNTVSFKGNDVPSVYAENPVERDINNAMGFLGINDMVVVGKDVHSAAKDLLSSAHTIPTVINNIYFVKDKDAGSTIGIGSNINGVPCIQNFGNETIYELEDGLYYELRKDDVMFIRDSAKFVNGKTSVPFKVEPNKEASVTDLKNGNIQIFEFGKLGFEQIAKVNRQRILTMISKKEAAKEADDGKLTFKDVGGQDKAIAELKEAIVYPIKYPEAFNVMNHGIILNGGPGTGKTLMAQALANEVDAEFIKLNGLELESKFVGQSEENMRKLFDEARQKQPCIIFIDEFDAIAKTREGSTTSRYDDKMVNQLLSLMSDIEKDKDQVFVVAATNKKELLDEAVVRSGRFGKQIDVPNPDEDGCKKIFNIHAKKTKVPMDENFRVDDYIKKLHKAKFSGAQIADVIGEAQNKAYLRGNIFEKMDNDLFTASDLENLRITEDDFNQAFISIKSREDSADKNPIGFVWNK